MMLFHQNQASWPPNGLPSSTRRCMHACKRPEAVSCAEEEEEGEQKEEDGVVALGLRSTTIRGGGSRGEPSMISISSCRRIESDLLASFFFQHFC